MSTPKEALQPNDDQRQDAQGAELRTQSPEERAALIEAAELFGATRIVNQIANRFGAQTMRMLQMVREKKVWREYGYKSFDDMLDNHPHSPMTKHQFYEREKVLGLEGDAAFNALNALKIPISKRKLLAEGDVAVEGSRMTIGQQEFDLADEDSVILAVSHLAMEYAKEKRKNARGTKDLEKYKRKADQFEAQIHSGAAGIHTDGLPYARALVGALGELTLLNQEIQKIEDPEERKRFGDQALERIAQAKLELEETLGYVAPEG